VKLTNLIHLPEGLNMSGALHSLPTYKFSNLHKESGK
jgi:hypothetical protein